MKVVLLWLQLWGQTPHHTWENWIWTIIIQENQEWSCSLIYWRIHTVNWRHYSELLTYCLFTVWYCVIFTVCCKMSHLMCVFMLLLFISNVFKCVCNSVLLCFSALRIRHSPGLVYDRSLSSDLFSRIKQLWWWSVRTRPTFPAVWELNHSYSDVEDP